MANMDMGGGGDPPKIVASEICILVDGVEVSLDDYVEGLVSGSDPDVKAALVACLAGLIVSPDPNVLKAAINACITAGLLPAEGGAVGGIIWQAIKACLSAPPVILETVGANPNVNAQTAAAGQPPGTLIIFPGGGTAQDPDWVWYVNANGTVTNIESPAGATPAVIPVTPAVATGDPTAPAGPTTFTVLDQNGNPRTLCEGDDGSSIYEEPCPYTDPRGKLMESYTGRDDKSKAYRRVPEHTSICAVARGPFNSGFVLISDDFPTGITELAGSYQDVLVVNNPSDCRDIPLMVDSSARLKYSVPRYNELDVATGEPEPTNESFTGFIAHQISINGGATWATVTSEQVNLGADGGEESHIDTTHQENQCFNLVAAGSMTFSTRAVYSSAGTISEIDNPRMRYMRARVQVYGSTE